MSNYPPTPSYGVIYGARDQQNPSYLPPTYPNQYLPSDDGRTSQAHMGNNYDTSMNAYGYNRTIPPFSAAAVASAVPPLPIFQGWNQDAIPLPAYNPTPYAATPPQNATQYNGYSGTVQTASYYQPTTQPNYQQPQISKPFEQDLDEGEFEDGAVATDTPPVGYSSSHYRPSDGTGYVDSAQRAVYSRPQDYSPQQSYPTNNYNYPPRDRDRSQTGGPQSASYSPYASSAGASNIEQVKGAQQQVPHTPGHTEEHHKDAAQSLYGSDKKTVNSSQPKANTNHQSSQNGENQCQPEPATPLSILPVNTNTVSTASGKSVAESRKKAQGAILNLWPYDVRYQTYIDEGFKEDIISRLFDDLKMVKTSKSGNGKEGFVEAEHVSKGHPRQDDNAALLSSNDSSRPAEATTSRTSRDNKVHISLRANGNATSSNATLPQTPTELNKGPSSAPAKSAEMNEKQRALELKKEALRKSREERAQKAAAKTIPSAAENVPVPEAAAQIEQTKVEVAPAASTVANYSPSKSPSIPKNEVQSPAQSSTPIFKQETVSRPTPQILPIQQVPAIPGLFLVSTEASSTPPVAVQTALPSPTHNNVRKRPVAADFDEPTSSMAPFKRPFGQSRNEKPLVIDVSDEEFESEDEDVAMDLESQAEQDSPAQPARKMSDQHATAIQNLPSLGNLPTRKPWSPPPFSSAASTPPLLHQTPRGALGKQEVLQRKEIEIEELKKKIAEAEAKKRAKQTPNGAQTPRTSESSSSEGRVATQPNALVSSKVETAGKIMDEQKIQEKQKIEQAKAQAAEQKHVEAEQRRLRREKIAGDLAALEAEEQRHLANVAKKKAEIAEEEAGVRLAQSEKQKMIEEMELLGQDTEEQLQIEKDKLNDLEPEINAGPPLPSGSATSPNSQPSQSITGQSTMVVPVLSPAGSTDNPQPSSPVQPAVSDAMVTLDPATLNGDIVESQTDGYSEQNPLKDHDDHVSEEIKDESKEGLSTDRALEAALQEAVRAEADSHAHTEDEMDIEVSYAPNTDQLDPQSPSSVADADKRSPDYSPVLDRNVIDMPDRESDDYEPPEATPPVDTPSPIDSPPFSPAPPATISDHVDDAMLGVNSTQNPHESANDKTEEILPLENGTSPRIPDNRAEETNHVQLFTPYESPLKHFRAYRFHPDFKQNVSGGLKSMTYSHRIDAKKEFCHFELEGRCNDADCDMQHFKDIGLPDDAVLTALGSPDEFRGEQRDRFCVGLKEVLLDLRVRKIRDFDIIASEIIAHRVKFLGDDSKVLPLEGTTI